MDRLNQPSGVVAAVEELYRVFARYERPVRVSPCTFCYEEQELEYLKATPLRSIEGEPARKLLWETADHWESAGAYKHYLPRILEVMTPAMGVEDMYPVHIFETLKAHAFAHWPAAERTAVGRFFEALEAFLHFVPGLESEAARQEWRAAAAELIRVPPQQ